MAVEMAGRRSVEAMAMTSDGEAARQVRPLPPPETASSLAESTIRRMVRKAGWTLETLLERPDGGGEKGQPRGVTDEELSGHTASWRLRVLAAVEVLKLAKGPAKRAVAARKAKGGPGEDAEDEPGDDSGVPDDLFEHLRRV